MAHSELSSRPLRLLASARDPAAAFHMATICKQAHRDSRFEVTLVAQQPAVELLRRSGLQAVPLPGHLARHGGPDEAALLALAEQVLANFQPDVILCGLSSPGEAGIDEALLARRSVPAALLQDFWGEQNKFFGGPPDLALVLDETARQLTLDRHGTAALVTGSAKHAHYAFFDAMAARQALREAHQIAPKATVWGWFGQPLQAFGGYHHTLSAWTRALASLQGEATVLYRPHPRETALQKAWTQQHLAAAGTRVVMAETCDTEAALVACDTMCTVLSNCAYDAAYLNFFSAAPLVVPVLLLFDTELRDFYQRTVDIRRLPYVDQQLTLTAWSESGLAEVLRNSIEPSTQRAVWGAARTVLPDPTQAVSRVLEAVWALGMACRPPKATLNA